ncbi:MAG: ABC transporter permease, partial [Oscillospiraceae bacterium]|nr:ABC transporter permease [Oscillospiraceae bacterium]
MGKALIKDNLRRIWKTRGRFLAILAIIAIGCGFFAGVKVTSPDMKATADKYYKDQRLMDIHLISTLGFSDKEIEKLAADDDILGICGGYSADLYIRSEDGASPVAKVYSIDTSAGESSENYINRPELTEGRMPEAPDECLIEVKTPDNFQIGDTITLETQDKDNPVTDTLKYQTFKIVGRVSWVKYVDFERGTTTLGSGSISSFLMIPEEAFASDYYTDVYITLNSTRDMDSFTDEYTDRINEKKFELEGLAEDIHKERIEEIRAELESARSEAADGEDEYQDGVEKFNAEIADAETKLQNAQAEIDAKQQELDDSIAQYSVSLAQYNSGVSEYNYGRS